MGHAHLSGAEKDSMLFSHEVVHPNINDVHFDNFIKACFTHYKTVFTHLS